MNPPSCALQFPLRSRCWLAAILLLLLGSFLEEASTFGVRPTIRAGETSYVSSFDSFNLLWRHAGTNLEPTQHKPRVFLRSARKLSLRMAATEERPASPSSPLLPKHDKLVQGTLENGLSYIILPNKVPAGRFEAHLEVLSGSAHELASQQGMAHLLEHVHLQLYSVLVVQVTF